MRVLTLFQITTVRSAWVFLVGSAALLIFGLFQAIQLFWFGVSGPTDEGDLWFFAAWFLASGSYITLACWALFSTPGRAFLTSQPQERSGKRTVLWFVKFLFACYAAAGATAILVGVIAIPFVEYAALLAVVGPDGWIYLLGVFLLWAPFVYKRLK